MEDKLQEEKDKVYEGLENTLNSIPSNKIQIVLVDLNTRVGKEPCLAQLQEIIVYTVKQTTSDLN